MSRRLAIVAALFLALVLTAMVLASRRHADADDAAFAPLRTAAPLGAPATVTVSRRAQERVPAGFVGVSFEYPAIGRYAGSDGRDPNPLLARLIASLSPRHSLVIRIGGDSTDTTWWPVPGRRRPAGVSYSLSYRWLATVRRLADETHAMLILGVDLEAHRRWLAGAEGAALVGALGSRVRALEPGNEPTRYSWIPWYRVGASHLVWARPPSYDFGSFNAEFARVAEVLPAGVPLAGPTLGGPAWMSNLPRFLATEPRVTLVTYHSYPLNRCFTPPSAPNYATMAHLLSPASSRGLARAVRPYVAVAQARGLPLRVDEMSSVACGGKRGVSNTLASALWVLDTLFAMARAGVAGVNVHTFPKAAYGLFHFHHTAEGWTVVASPEYYGLLAFVHAAPAGSRLVSVTARGSPQIRAWATRGADGRIRVVLINIGSTLAHSVRLRLPGGARQLTVEALRGPSLRATGGVTLGGATIAPRSGRLGARRLGLVSRSVLGLFRVVLPPATAAILTTGRA
jgi:hypothetical protein